MEPEIKIALLLFVLLIILMFVVVILANRDKRKKEDKKKVIDFQKLLRAQLNNSGWRKNPGKTPEETSKKIVQYLKDHHIDTEFNALMRSISHYPKHQHYRPLTDVQTSEILEDAHILLLGLYTEYRTTRRQTQMLREQKIDELQKEFFDRLESTILDKIDPIC